MGCRGVSILLLRLLSCFLKTSADFWSLNGSSIRTGCSTGTTGGGLETFDSLDLMKDKIVESTSLFVRSTAHLYGTVSPSGLNQAPVVQRQDNFIRWIRHYSGPS